MSYKVGFSLAPTSNFALLGSLSNDLLLYTVNSNQRILIGTSNFIPAITVTSNNVGIAKSNPAYTLDITGDLNFTGTLRQGGTAYVGSQWSNSSSNVFIIGSNIGIGLSNPSYALDIQGGNIRITNGGNVVGNGGSIGFMANAGYSPMATISGYLTYAGDAGGLAFNTRLNTGASSSNNALLMRMYIGDNGNVGIGTINPGYLLDVQSATTAYMRLYGSTSNTNANFILGVSSASNTIIYKKYSDSTLRIQNDGQDTIILLNSNVGIGTTSPQYPLDVTGNARFNLTSSLSNNILLQGTGNTGGSVNIDMATYSAASPANARISAIDDGNYGAHLAFLTKNDGNFSNAFVERMRINGNNGYIGIGTTNPSYSLDVNGSVRVLSNISSQYTYLQISSYAPSNTIFLEGTRGGYIGDSAISFNSYVVGNNSYNFWNPAKSRWSMICSQYVSYDSFRFEYSPPQATQGNGVQFLTFSNVGSYASNGIPIINASFAGNVGIGTSNPTAPLSVVGTGTGGGNTPVAQFFNNIAIPCLLIGSTAGNNLYINYTSNTNYAQLGVFNGSANINITGSNIGINTSNPTAPLHVYNTNYLSSTAGSSNIIATFSTNDNNIASLHIKDYRNYTGNQWNQSTTKIQKQIDTSYGGYIDFGLSNDLGGIAFGAQTTEFMRIVTSGTYPNAAYGNVGIGTTTPGSTLSIGGNVSIGYSNITAPTNGLAIQGNVAIGSTSNPGVPLYIYSYGTGSNGVSGYYFNGSTSTLQVAGAGSYAVTSIVTSGSILCGNAFVAASDSRIKRIIESSNNDLDLIDQVNVKRYEYIDKLAKGHKVKVGYIAQQVKPIIPDAVSINTEVIPDIYRVSDNIENNIITLSNHELKENDKIKIIKENGDVQGYIMKVMEIIDKNKFIINLSQDEKLNDKVFIYGREVDDFHSLDYDMLSAIAFNGVKELNKLRKEQNNLIEDLKKRIETLEKRH